MKFHRLTFFFALFFVFGCTVADERPARIIATIGIEEIRAHPATISEFQQISTGQPDKEILLIAKEAGYTTVVDLRGPAEDRGLDEASEVSALGMRYFSLPVVDAADVNFDNAAALDEILAGSDGPVLLHCASGNRVGALYALREKLAGASDEAALELGKAAGLTRLEPVVVERLHSR